MTLSCLYCKRIRQRRKIYKNTKKIENLRLMIDASSISVVNDGKHVMSSRMYPSEYKGIKVNGNITGKLYKLDV